MINVDNKNTKFLTHDFRVEYIPSRRVYRITAQDGYMVSAPACHTLSEAIDECRKMQEEFDIRTERVQAVCELAGVEQDEAYKYLLRTEWNVPAAVEYILAGKYGHSVI